MDEMQCHIPIIFQGVCKAQDCAAHVLVITITAVTILRPGYLKYGLLFNDPSHPKTFSGKDSFECSNTIRNLVWGNKGKVFSYGDAPDVELTVSGDCTGPIMILPLKNFANIF